MNYIELLGISASGKTTLKKKLTKKSKKKIYDKKYIIINFYICNYKINLIHYLKSMSLLFLSSKISMKMKPKIRKTGIIFKSQKKTIFVNNKRNSMLKLLDYVHELTVDRYLTYQVLGELRQHMQDQGQLVQSYLQLLAY